VEEGNVKVFPGVSWL